MFLDKLFVIAPNWTRPQCQSVVDQTHKACSSHTMENYHNEHEWRTSATRNGDESYNVWQTMSEIQEYILYDSTYMKFRTTKLFCSMLEVRTVVNWGKSKSNDCKRWGIWKTVKLCFFRWVEVKDLDSFFTVKIRALWHCMVYVYKKFTDQKIQRKKFMKWRWKSPFSLQSYNSKVTPNLKCGR